eukprot:GHVP01039336.1.p1 GENE.GHVP01039336.1~~GHVP01039336.1.p1  ORF type:complete len:578 (+),score=116.17 GHVP01039336.1:3-1736(+)
MHAQKRMPKEIKRNLTKGAKKTREFRKNFNSKGDKATNSSKPNKRIFKGKKKFVNVPRNARPSKQQLEENEVEKLEESISKLEIENFASSFELIPISQRTKDALKKNKWERLTEIQKKVIPRALKGENVIGEAKTGSGKTLAAVVPVVELLYREGWTAADGTMAIILAPTRELAAQIFEVYQKVGQFHNVTVSCVFGGKFMDLETASVEKAGTLIGTPGRVLDHLEQTELFNVQNLRIVVVDEADRMLDLGFKPTLIKIFDSCPSERQSIWLSATIGAEVQNISEYCMGKTSSHVRGGVFQGVEETDMPETLKQYHRIVPMTEKIGYLFYFLRLQKKRKIVVFVTTCKQVRFLYEVLRRMKTGSKIKELHGGQGQQKRMEIFQVFSEMPNNATLITTDIAARGVDFPVVDWVVHMDAPDSANSYVHRSGRTARNNKEGKSLLLLLPSEVSFLERLKQKKIQTSEYGPMTKKTDIRNGVRAVMTSVPHVKYLAERSLVSYMKAVSTMPDKETFRLSELPIKEGAASLGLSEAPEEVLALVEQKHNLGQKEFNAPKKKNRGLDKLKAKIREKKQQKAES